nr:uncharacterized protein LOC127309961 [Lolium perenne]
MAFIKNTIENAIVGSITECASAGEYLEKIKSQFTGSSKTYATQLLKQLVTEKYTGGAHGIREHILRMSNLAAKLKPMDADLELKPALLVHLVMASLPQQFDYFVINYNMSPKKWDIEKTIAMCVQEKDRLKAQNGGTINYVKDNKKKALHTKQQWFSFKAICKSPNAASEVPAQATASEQRSVPSLSEDWALQERLSRLAERINGKERDSIRRGL